VYEEMKMKRIFSILMIFLIALTFISCSADKENNTDETDLYTTEVTPQENFSDKKILVAYFSQPDEETKDIAKNGTAEVAAKIIKEKLNADIFRIETKKEYPENKEECLKIAQEEKDNAERPELKKDAGDISSYDVIFIGYPIWCEDAPMAVYTFLESYDFSNKDIIPFSTYSEPPSITASHKIKVAVPSSYVDIGYAISDRIITGTEEELEKRITSWLSQLSHM